MNRYAIAAIANIAKSPFVVSAALGGPIVVQSTNSGRCLPPERILKALLLGFAQTLPAISTKMITAEEYRGLAESQRKAAVGTSPGPAREALLAMAGKYDAIALEVDQAAGSLPLRLRSGNFARRF